MEFLYKCGLFLNFLLLVTGLDPIVRCLYNSSCLLPSNYKHGDATNIRWLYRKEGVATVYSSFSENTDQFDHQDPRFKGRASLVEDQITERKTELLLKNVKVEDEGTYHFVTNSEKHGYQQTYVVLQVDAPVQRVDIIRAGNNFTCSSKGIYPKPELTWSAIPRFKVNPQSNSTVNQTEGKLYSISNSLELPDVDGNLLLSCTVSTRLKKWTSTWRRPIVTNTSWAEIPCSNTNTSLGGFSLVWKFNHTDIIMKWNMTDEQHVSARWKKHIQADKVSEVLHLRNLSSDLYGTYSCELSSAKETTATHTLLTMDKRSHLYQLTQCERLAIGCDQRSWWWKPLRCISGSCSLNWAWLHGPNKPLLDKAGGTRLIVGEVIGIAIIVITVIAIAGTGCFIYHTRCQRNNGRNANSLEMEPMKSHLEPSGLGDQHSDLPKSHALSYGHCLMDTDWSNA